MTARSLLPPNTTQLERDLEQATARQGAVRIDIANNWNPHTCDAALLPWLAWAVGVEEWDSTWPVQLQRDTIANTRAIRQTKGTPYAVKLALTAMGHPNAQLVERSDEFRGKRNGAWATFEIKLTRPVSRAQAALIRQRIENVKRVCCHLTALDFTSNPIKYNRTIKYDGTYSHGVV
jgi:phage tail P2-like protein